MLVSAGLTLGKRLGFSSFLWGQGGKSTLHSFTLPVNKIYQASTISLEKRSFCWESKDKQVIHAFEGLAGAVTEEDQAAGYSEHIREWSAALIGQSR